VGELAKAISGIATAGALYLLAGEPGIGKTRLATEATSIARDRSVRASWGRCWEAGGAPPFWPWREALEGCGVEFPDAVTGADPNEARFALFQNVATVLGREAARQPLLIVLEDLHAADQPTLLLLEFVARKLTTLPIVVVATYRELEARLRPDAGDVLARLGRSGRVFRLGTLSERDVATLVAEAIEGADAELAAKVHEVTHGNPLFVTEMVRDVRARGLQDGVSIPLGVREIIRQRLVRISEDVRPVLDAAAVLGVEVSVAVLGRLVGNLQTVMDDALRSGLLTARGDRLRFSHSLYREGLYHELPRLRRQALHREAARALSDVGASHEEIAHHLFESGPELAAEAIDHAVRAATHAVDVFAFEEATALLQRATSAIPHGPIENHLRCQVLTAQGEARIRSGDATGRELCAQAAKIARELGDAALLARAGLAYGCVFITGGVDPFLVGVLEEAFSRMAEEDSALRARVMARLAAARQPGPEETRRRDRELGQAAVAMARRVGDRRELLAVLHSVSGIMYGEADPTVRLPFTREQERLAEELGDTARLLHARVRLAIDYLELADFASYASLAASYETLARRIGPAAEPWRVPLMRSTLALRHDRFDESRQWQEESRKIESERPRARRAQALHRICFLRAAERHAEIRESLPELRNLWLDMPYGVVMAEPRVASSLARIGADDEVRDLLGKLPEHVFAELINAAALAEAIWATADEKRAQQLYPMVETHASRWNMYWFDCEIVEAPMTRLLAYLAGITGDWDQCDRMFERALRVVETVGRRSMLARMRFELGDLFVRAGREPERARALLTQARELASGIGLSDLVSLIDRRHPAIVEPALATPGAPASRRFSIVAEGEYFAIGTSRRILRFKATRGMQYLARLVERPDAPVHVLELVGSGDHPDRGDAGELLDASAFRAYRARLESLREASEDAEARGDTEEFERARDEMETIAQELARATGQGGRPRRGESAVDRARSAVQRRIKDAIQRIAEQDSELGVWLQRAVRTGNYCSFRPND
jgi:AAA ATPase domain